MNPYGYGYAEPVVPPPRRKRSLSTSRTDPTIHDDSFGFPNRMRRNFSTDHIPNDYMYGNGPRPLGNVPMGNYMSTQHQPSQYRQPYNSSGNLYSPMQPPGLRMANPVPFQVLNSKVPIRPHQDYLKYAQGANVPYNPYSSSFNPTLMARPTIEPFQSTAIPTSIASAIVRGRDPTLYSSKEHIQSGQMSPGDYRRDMFMGQGFHGKSPPERPPPPRYSSGLSTENLADYELDMNSRHLRDRRSVSPSRFSPTEQRPYNIRRSTSPLPSALNSRSPELPLSRSGSKTSLNHSNYGNPLRMSRESSPLLARSPSPFSQNSPYSFATNHSYAHEYKPLTRTASNSKYTSRSSILGDSSSRTPHSFVSGLSSPSGHNSSSIASNANNKDFLLATSNSVLPKDRQLDVDANSKTVSSSVDESNFNRHMDTLRVPNGNDEAANRNGNLAMTVPKQMDRQFSESFTDHCDQYKSLTSKILGKKGNRRSGDFSDVILEPLETDNTIRKSSFSPSFTPDARDYDNCYENHEPTDSFLANEVFENPVDLFDASLQQQPTQIPQPTPMRNDVLEIRGQSPKPVSPVVRRSSSSNGLAGQQRKGSLPGDYISNANSIALSNEWSREKVADMAHQARQRLQNPSNSTSTTFKKIGTWFTRQFVFLLIAGLNILLAYVFYSLLAMLPMDDTVRK